MEGTKMYRIEKRPYHYKMTFEGFITAAEMKQWLSDSRKTLAEAGGKFGLILDMRAMRPLSETALEIMREGRRMLSESGLERAAVALNAHSISKNFQSLFKDSNDRSDRYIDASRTASWETIGLRWALQGIDPDQAH
jgi:hypothetical protein